MEERGFKQEFKRLGIRDKDIVERFVRARGPGGQNVNKVSSCVYLKHLPTGIEVKCRKERSQALNRYIARQLLAKKVKALFLEKARLKRERFEKLRRQKRKRSKAAKLMILEAKRRRSERKRLRAKVREFD